MPLPTAVSLNGQQLPAPPPRSLTSTPAPRCPRRPWSPGRVGPPPAAPSSTGAAPSSGRLDESAPLAASPARAPLEAALGGEACPRPARGGPASRAGGGAEGGALRGSRRRDVASFALEVSLNNGGLLARARGEGGERTLAADARVADAGVGAVGGRNRLPRLRTRWSGGADGGCRFGAEGGAPARAAKLDPLRRRGDRRLPQCDEHASRLQRGTPRRRSPTPTVPASAATTARGMSTPLNAQQYSPPLPFMFFDPIVSALSPAAGPRDSTTAIYVLGARFSAADRGGALLVPPRQRRATRPRRHAPQRDHDRVRVRARPYRGRRTARERGGRPPARRRGLAQRATITTPTPTRATPTSVRALKGAAASASTRAS